MRLEGRAKCSGIDELCSTIVNLFIYLKPPWQERGKYDHRYSDMLKVHYHRWERPTLLEIRGGWGGGGSATRILKPLVLENPEASFQGFLEKFRGSKYVLSEKPLRPGFLRVSKWYKWTHWGYTFHRETLYWSNTLLSSLAGNPFLKYDYTLYNEIICNEIIYHRIMQMQVFSWCHAMVLIKRSMIIWHSLSH
jgi:hypothetical protein